MKISQNIWPLLHGWNSLGNVFNSCLTSLQVCCPNYCWLVQMDASPLQTYRQIAGLLKASLNISIKLPVSVLNLMKLNWCLSISAGVKQPPLGSGNKLLRQDVGLISRANRSELCVFLFFYLKGVFLFVAVILRPRSSLCSDDRMQFSSSQPDFAAGGWEAMLLIGQTEGQVSFSQPTKPEHMLLGSQLLGTPGASQVIYILSDMSICNFFIEYTWKCVWIFSNTDSASLLKESRNYYCGVFFLYRASLLYEILL